MTVIRPNSISGVTSITSQSGDIQIFRADGSVSDLTVNNITSGVVTATTFSGNISGNLSGGTINATSGTITGNLGVGGVLTYEDVTNIDSVGVVTARSGVNVSGGEIKVGAAVTVSSGGVITSGIVTATSFSGSGANLTGISGGKILQVQSTTRTDTFSASIGKNTFSGAAISVSITPASASNKILILANLTIGLQSDNDVGFAIFKDGSIIQAATGDANGSAQRIHAQSFNSHYQHQNNVNGMFLDTAGGTSAITYDCRLCHGNNSDSGHTIYLNRDHSYLTQTQHQYSRSCITVMEIEA
tara:strand:- start:212 stop:1114 length:903 start_codon:yes stop_codon:yes gene_type:complete